MHIKGILNLARKKRKNIARTCRSRLQIIFFLSEHKEVCPAKSLKIDPLLIWCIISKIKPATVNLSTPNPPSPSVASGRSGVEGRCVYSLHPGQGVFIPVLWAPAAQLSGIFAVPLTVHRREEVLNSLLNKEMLSFVTVLKFSLLGNYWKMKKEKQHKCNQNKEDVFQGKVRL